MKPSNRVIVIGAGIGGLSAAACLAKAGFDVVVLEAHVYPGGCAGTFYHQGYRFDAGATLAGGFYPGGPMDMLAQAAGIDHWPGRPARPAMVVHLPDGETIPRVAGDERWDLYRQLFGETGVDFWRWQERTANAMWDLAQRLPPWPPQSPRDILRLIQMGLTLPAQGPLPRLDQILLDTSRPVSTHLINASERLRLFVDAQLLISAQTTSADANALYGASALDLPRREVVHLEGGMGIIAQRLAESIRQHGGKVLYRQEVRRISINDRKLTTVVTKKGDSFLADLVIANLTPWNVVALLGTQAPPRLRSLPPRPKRGWGAFTIYCGVDGALIPGGFPLHHQVVIQRPLGEGNSVFLSLSPAWDSNRAPVGHRALTLSTHTSLDDWWELFEKDLPAYQARVEQFTQKIMSASERVLPGLHQAVDLLLPGTPVTFKRFTRRAWGWVGGFPQVNLFQNWGARLLPNLWMVGDSIFPGQSVAATALGGLSVAARILQECRMAGLETGQNWAVSS